MPHPRRPPPPISSPVVVAAIDKIPNFRSLLGTDNENVVLEIECIQGIGEIDAMTFGCGFIAVSLICAAGMAGATAI
jgi:hypothetical protein